MVKPKSFESIINSLRERKKFEKESREKLHNEKCKHCGGNIMAIGKSSIPGVCNICTHLALLPKE